MDKTGCNYCGEDFVTGDQFRTHARGGAIHERCYKSHAADLERASGHADNTAKARREAAKQLAVLPSFYSTEVFTF